jgi:predicted AAA+ superfamily ATPase
MRVGDAALERKIMNRLIEWKNGENRKPLILQGARQVGKTYIALTFGNESYKNVAYFSCENNEAFEKIFDRDFDTDRIIKELSALSGQSIFKHDTLVFFDEIQACEKALTSLKYFNESNNDYHIIAAGSLLGVAVNRERYSFPVGKVDMMTLYPLDFEEFLMALGKQDLLTLIREHYESDIEFPLHEKGMDYYRAYLAVGGMPAAVLEYAQKQDFNFVLSVQKTINDSYIADMAKYATAAETIRIMAAYQSIPAQLAKENKKFQYKLIKSGARAHEYELSINWLTGSGVITKVCKIREGVLPLTAFADYESFKIYLTDVGLLCSKFGIPANMILHGDPTLNSTKGTLTENYVAAALVSSGFTPFYWESNGQAEVDFVVQNRAGEIIPIEVKAADNVRARSLGVFMKKYQPSYAVRISAKNFGFENNIKSVPLYAVFCMKE